MEIKGLTQLQRELADQLWALDTLEEVHGFIDGLPKRLRGQARLVLAMIEIAAIDDIVSNDDLDLAKSVIDRVR
jgi:hypothetical protein